tara:strand:- start:310 stop:555 length:246 start_codon:yes stop_codon:yes gene_type:complete
MLAVVLLAWIIILIQHFRGRIPEGGLVLLVGFGIASFALGWLVFGRHTVLLVGDGLLTIPSWFGGINIPLATKPRPLHNAA